MLSFLFISLQLSSQELSEFTGPWRQDFYQDDQKISREQFRSLILCDADAAPLWKIYQRHSSIAIGSFLGAGALAIWANSRSNADKSTAVPAVGAFAGFIVGLGFNTSAFKNKKKAILTYNRKFDISSVHLGQTANGLGLVMTF